MSKQLQVFLHERLAGVLSDVGNARLEFAYRHDYLQDNPVALSQSLPLTIESFDDSRARPFFSGLLPDDQELDGLARYLKVSKQNVFKLLSLVGGECAGAVSLFSDSAAGRLPTHAESDLSEVELEDILLSGRARPLLGGDDRIRLSLAGAQAKLAVTIDKKKVSLSTLNSPSTHILKPPSKVVDSLVQNEYFCMRLAKLVGIMVPETRIRSVGNVDVYEVERYDREISENNISRLHQEDFCQALGVPPENKYESEGGPGLQQCMGLIQAKSSRPAIDLQRFLGRVIFNYLIGNNDAHAKNFSLLYKNGGARLAPAYDLVSTAIYVDLNEKMAMKIGGRYNAKDLQRRHWTRLVSDTQTARNALQKRVLDLCKVSESALSSSQLTTDHHTRDNVIIHDLTKLVQRRIESLQSSFT